MKEKRGEEKEYRAFEETVDDDVNVGAGAATKRPDHQPEHAWASLCGDDGHAVGDSDAGVVDAEAAEVHRRQRQQVRQQLLASLLAHQKGVLREALSHRVLVPTIRHKDIVLARGMNLHQPGKNISISSPHDTIR